MKNQILSFLFSVLLLLGNALQAQVLTPGMDAVTTHYGYKDAIHPGTVAEVQIIGDQSGAPHGSNWVPPAKLPPITSWTVDTMGQVFGIAIDDAGNVYFSSTAMYWGGTNPQRLADPAPAVSGSGGGGYHLSGGPAGIYKADKLNLNNVTVLTGSINAGGGIGTKKIPNTGYGLGNIAYAKPNINKLYTSNLEDGKLYCIDPATGTITDVYDPFGVDASGAQIAAYGERIFGLAVNYEAAETRLYYAVLMSNNQSVIWSVQLNSSTGAFNTATNSIEINLPLSYARTFVGDIAFSSRGEMLVAEKGHPHNANVYQYFGKHNAWSLPNTLFMSAYNGGNGMGHNSAGGVDYGYSSNKGATQNQFFCDTIIWTQSNAIGSVGGSFLSYGLLSHPLNDYLNPNTYLNEAYIVNLIGAVPIYGLTPKGSFGDVECFDWDCPPRQTDICSKTNARLTKTATGECCYKVEISNKYRDDYFSAISISSPSLAIDNVTKDANCNWANISFQSPTKVVFTKRIFYDGIPLDTLGLYQALGTICFSGRGSDNVTINFIGNAPQYDTVCRKIVKIDGCNIPIDTSCVTVMNLKAECSAGAMILKFRIKNNSSFTMRGITLYPLNPDVMPTPRFIPIADLLPGQVSPYYTTALVVANNAKNACFFFSTCDQNTTPGIAGPYPTWCCMDSIRYCIDIPQCDPCSGISFSAKSQDPVKCCYSLTLTDNYFNANIAFLEFDGTGGTQFALFSGWNIIPFVSSSHIKIQAPGTGISPGIYPDFASFCLTGTSTSPHTILIRSFDAKGILLCTDTLKFEGCQLVTPSCANIVNDSLYCSGDKIKYTFYVKNNSPFPLYQVDFRTSDVSVRLDIDHVQPNPAIPIGKTGGPYTVTIDSIDSNLDRFCIYLTGHNGIYDPVNGLAATECCTDSLGVVCLPMIKCGAGCDTTICCQFGNMTIPNGITPNEDGINDAFEILNSSCCNNISIKVFNRWGNLVYHNDNYLNDWKGANDSGTKLEQGTYFVLLELPTGNKKGIYVDIRY